MAPRILELRVHTDEIEPNGPRQAASSRRGDRWPVHALILDCETRIDERQSLTFGAYQYARWTGDCYAPVEEGLFHANDLDAAELAVLTAYAGRHGLRLESRTVFLTRVFWRVVRAGTLIVGFNLPFDLTRVADDVVWTPRRRGGWSCVMGHYIDPRTREPRESPYRPRLIIRPRDGKGSFFRLGRAKASYPPIRCLDLRTLTWALESRSHTLASACQSRGVPGKLDHEPTGRVTVEEIDYNRQDVQATVNLLNALRAEFDRHPTDLDPDRAYSPASMVKAYFRAMGLTPPRERFTLPPELSGIAMEGYYGGRAECRIRHTVVPVVHTDFHSQYPTVHTLMDLQALLIAKRLDVVDATEEVRDLLARVTPAEVLEPDFWTRLAFFALVQPTGDVLPARTTYNDATSNIGVNPLTADAPIWFAGPDLAAAALLSGKAPRILRAVRLVPRGRQAGLKGVRLRGAVPIDPRTVSVFKRVIEARAAVKADRTRPDVERAALSYFLKILANSGAYGLFVELNPEPVGKDPKTGKPRRAPLRVWAGERCFDTTTDVVERPGVWYCPWLGALTTAGGRLLLALLERLVTDAGGTYLMCDTDSMAIVATQTGGLVPCRGGHYRQPDGQDAIRALSWAQVRHIVAAFESLNPYNRRTVPGSILKIEAVNKDRAGHQRVIHGYGIAAKRYALFERLPDGDIRVVKASGHGLGYLYRPLPGYDDALDQPAWVVEAWAWIVRTALRLLGPEPAWFSRPAMMRVAITTPEVLKALQDRERRSPYAKRIKPLNFVLSPILETLAGVPTGAVPEAFLLIGPFMADPSRWFAVRWVNLYDGQPYALAPADRRQPSEAQARSYGDVVGRYRWHPEAKSLDPDGTRCGPHSAGLLRRTPVTAAEPFRSIGKETDRRWEREEDISLLTARVVEYRPNETARIVSEPTLQHRARQVSTRKLARAAHVSQTTVKRIRQGRPVRKATARKLDAILRDLSEA